MLDRSLSVLPPRSPGALPRSTMMGKLPLGVVSPYVKMSSGGCTDPLKFYATSYCIAYGEGSLGAGPTPGHSQDRGGSPAGTEAAPLACHTLGVTPAY